MIFFIDIKEKKWYKITMLTDGVYFCFCYAINKELLGAQMFKNFTNQENQQ